MLRNLFIRFALHYLALTIAFLSGSYVVNNYLTYIFDFPGMYGFFEFLNLPFEGFGILCIELNILKIFRLT